MGHSRSFEASRNLCKCSHTHADDATDLGINEREPNSETFELLTLKDRLCASPLDIHDGKGFLILRGLDPARCSPEDNPIIILEISSYDGEKWASKQTEGASLVSHHL